MHGGYRPSERFACCFDIILEKFCDDFDLNDAQQLIEMAQNLEYETTIQKLTNELLCLMEDSRSENQLDMTDTYQSLRAKALAAIVQWHKEHRSLLTETASPSTVQYAVPPSDVVNYSASEIMHDNRLLALLVWRIAHSTSLRLLESSTHILLVLCLRSTAYSICFAPLHESLPLWRCEALLFRVSQNSDRFCDESLTLTSSVLSLIAMIMECSPKESLVSLEFVQALPEILMDRVLSLDIVICSLHILNILVAQVIGLQPVIVPPVAEALCLTSSSEITPFEDSEGMEMSDSSMNESKDQVGQVGQVNYESISDDSEDNESVNEVYHSPSQFNYPTLSFRTPSISLPSPASSLSLRTLFESSSFLFCLQCIHYSMHSQHCISLAHSLLRRLHSAPVLPPNRLPHSSYIEQPLIQASLSYLSSHNPSDLSISLSVLSHVLLEPSFRTLLEPNSLLSSLLSLLRAWNDTPSSIIETVFDLLQTLITQYSFSNIRPISVVLFRLLQQLPAKLPATLPFLKRVSFLLRKLSSTSALQFRSSGILTISDLFLELLNYPSTSLTDDLVYLICFVLRTQPSLVDSVVAKRLSDTLIKVILNVPNMYMQNRCMELLVQLPVQFDCEEGLFWPCIRLLRGTPDSIQKDIIPRLLHVIIELVKQYKKLIPSVLRSPTLMYLVMVLQMNASMELLSEISQLIMELVEDKQTDLLLAACNFGAILEGIAVTAKKEEDTTKVQCVEQIIQTIQNKCPITTLLIKSYETSQVEGVKDVNNQVEVREIGKKQENEQRTLDEVVESLICSAPVEIPQLTDEFISLFKDNSLSLSEIEAVSDKVSHWVCHCGFKDSLGVYYVTSLCYLVDGLVI